MITLLADAIGVILACCIVGLSIRFPRGWKRPRLRSRKKPTPLQQTDAFAELYRWKRERRLQEQQEFRDQLVNLEASLPGATRTVKSFGSGATEWVTVRNSAGDVIIQYPQRSRSATERMRRR